ncbi:Ig-like domain-containing protein [Chitinivorax sp. B]|uniref:Ig-like domain-containing protein n=1 Tax=Chitinivorax sp. B TaxID=2502235 RepID=UPI0010F6D681|nr:Ig-like domain-containing protein [Chitinivorax sp. B]
MHAIPFSKALLVCTLALLASCGDSNKTLSVTAATPSAGASNVDPATTFSVQFSEDMDPATLNSNTVKLISAQGEIPATVVVSGAEVKLTPTMPLGLASPYQLELSADIRSMKGNGLPGKTTISITTRQGQWGATSTHLTASGNASSLSSTAGKDGSIVVASLRKTGSTTTGLTIARFDPSTAQWSTTDMDAGTSGQASHVVIKVLDSGDALVAWNSSTALLPTSGSHAVYSRFSKAGGSWSPPEAIGQDTHTFDADIAVTSSGSAALIWHHRNSGNPANIYTRQLDSNGTLTDPVKLGTGTTNGSSCAKQQVDSNGNIVAIWRAADNTGNAVMTARYDTATKRWASTDTLYRTSTVLDCDVQLKADIKGNLVASWQQRTSATPTGNDDYTLFASRYRASDSRWDSPKQFDAFNALRTTTPGIALDKDGNAVLSWMVTLADNLQGVTYSVKGANYPVDNSQGQTILLGNGTGQRVTTPALLKNANGDATAAWAVDGKLLSRQFNNNTWQATETPVTNFNNSREPNQIAIVQDEAGGGLVAWLVTDNVTNTSAYALRFNTDGRWDSATLLASGNETGDATFLSGAMTNGRMAVQWNRGNTVAGRTYR